MSTSNTGHPPPSIQPITRVLGRLRRRFFEAMGSERYSRRARSNIDRKLAAHLPVRGVFIEAGASDGVSESNTYYLERCRNWTGVLIEPIPELYRICVRERPGSVVFNCALVGEDYPMATATMRYGHLMSLVKGSLGGTEEEERHLELAREWHGDVGYEVEVPARTLTSILNELAIERVDFLSLDVEGYESNVLNGLDFERCRPTFLLIECLDEPALERVRSLLAGRYQHPAQLTPRDYLFRLRD